MSDVSIVIIGRNEERGIAKCLHAAQAAAEQIGGAEIIYVDSASTDETTKIAASLGAQIIALDSEQRLCPSAGRYAGTLAATREFILFLDADTLIYKDFLPAAIEHFRKHPDLAGVNGRIDDTDESGVLLSGVEDRFESVAETEWLRGPACFYRRHALVAAGSFDPQMIVEEEAELGLRLLKNGWRINLLPIPMALHTRCHHYQTFKSIFTTFRRDYAIGRLGEVVKTIACAFRQGFGLKFCWLRLKTTIIFTVWLLSFLLAAFFYLISLPILAIICAVGTLAGFLAVWIKKRSFYQAVLFFPAKFLCLVDVLAGIPKIGTDNFRRNGSERKSDCPRNTRNIRKEEMF